MEKKIKSVPPSFKEKKISGGNIKIESSTLLKYLIFQT